jgi:hypothetical protein
MSDTVGNHARPFFRDRAMNDGRGTRGTLGAESQNRRPDRAKRTLLQPSLLALALSAFHSRLSSRLRSAAALCNLCPLWQSRVLKGLR